ncbi:hypothetical protein COCVIDRAFT_25268 [Bipolaris victoriae FI3]|uniref:Uncharacterized protein n=1 Tax=Bipolaris victoriae (strain FI3) TaxID=930091 RepID=W7EKN8_BIPV3|nr:hypothetical protein COCVIDRAFT_25268 [Bipolaris victoriae FI3]
MEDFRFPTENPMLPDYKKKGCIINVELIRITAKFFKHLNIFPEDVEWLENFLSEFKGNTSTYFAPSSEVSLLERYCREYWQINLRFQQNVPKRMDLVRLFKSEDSKKAAARPAALPSCFRPQGNKTIHPELEALREEYETAWGVEPSSSGPSQPRESFTEMVAKEEEKERLYGPKVTGPMFARAVFESLKELEPAGAADVDWPRFIDLYERAHTTLAEKRLEIECEHIMNRAELEKEVAGLSLSEKKDKRKAGEE